MGRRMRRHRYEKTSLPTGFVVMRKPPGEKFTEYFPESSYHRRYGGRRAIELEWARHFPTEKKAQLTANESNLTLEPNQKGAIWKVVPAEKLWVKAYDWQNEKVVRVYVPPRVLGWRYHTTPKSLLSSSIKEEHNSIRESKRDIQHSQKIIAKYHRLIRKYKNP